jgi:hypothetical protein
MTIIITPGRITREIQEEFNAVFPFLRVEFFTRIDYTMIARCTVIPEMLPATSAGSNNVAVDLNITPYTTVKDFRLDVEDRFGICTQVYRKTGNLWHKITFTESWTMKQQDQSGYEISSIVNNQVYSTAGKACYKGLL